jgi:hypothetical protein
VFRARLRAKPPSLREKRDLIKHEHFREICAAASIGQATPEELFELEQHAAKCEACEKAYFDYLNLAAEQFVMANDNPNLSSQAAKESLNSELFTRRFFERAEREGIQFSADVGQEVRQLAPVIRAGLPQKVWQVSVNVIAAAMLVGLAVLGGYFYGKQSGRRDLKTKNTSKNSVTNSVDGIGQHIAELAARNAKLEAEINGLKTELAQAGERLRATQTDLHLTSEDRERLALDRAALAAQLKTVGEALAESQVLVTSAQQEAAKHRDRASAIEATLIADNIKISDLTDALTEKSDALDKERQLLALGHDVNDLMGARNLHIVDVVDTDLHGKTRPAFGRVFFTEGKSLVFYAFDLNDAKIQKANYQYRVWAKQEGGDKQVRSLGIFYSDDKAQRRWVFKCNDPKILSVIDSVFVTLEPTDSDPSHPKGSNLMYAYLRGQPNHP